jgi:Peptidase family S41
MPIHDPPRGARLLTALLALAGALALPAARAANATADGTPFDARRAWDELSELLRMDYPYLQRPGVDGAAILAEFAPRALATTEPRAFIRVADQMARNFADPHLHVGPGFDDDPSLVPTASDLDGDVRDGRFVVRDVRADSDASRQGVEAGAMVLAIDGREPAVAIESLLGRPAAALSRAQLAYGLNLALAGTREQPRRLLLQQHGQTREFALRAAAEQARAVQAAPAVDSERRGTLGIIRFNNSLGRDETIAAFDRAVQSLLDAPALVIDLRNTPSGGTTTVARAILSHFTARERPYQVHTVPGELRRYGVGRKFVEYVVPRAPHYRGRVFVLGGRWTGSMGEGIVIGFDALGARSVGSEMGHLLGALFHETLIASGAHVELAEEQLFHVDGTPREAFRPRLYVEPAEATPRSDPALQAVQRVLRAR